MKGNPETNLEMEEIELFRGNAPCKSLFGAFGNGLKETRLTAGLGYLISLHPEAFMGFLSLKGRVNRVSLEPKEDSGRNDIRISTSEGKDWVIEAKVPATNPRQQAEGYSAYRKILLTNYKPSTSDLDSKVKYISWIQLAEFLTESSCFKKNPIRFLTIEFLNYLREYNMIPNDTADEVYIRMLGDFASANLFLKATMYRCGYNESKRLSSVRYFAPHITWRLVKMHPEFTYGVSYVARIDSIEVAESHEDWKKLSVAKLGRPWLRAHEKELDSFSKAYEWKTGKKETILFLGPPRRIFNPPLRPKSIQKGRGYIGGYFSFDELFSAWTGEGILEA